MYMIDKGICDFAFKRLAIPDKTPAPTTNRDPMAALANPPILGNRLNTLPKQLGKITKQLRMAPPENTNPFSYWQAIEIDFL